MPHVMCQLCFREPIRWQFPNTCTLEKISLHRRGGAGGEEVNIPWLAYIVGHEQIL